MTYLSRAMLEVIILGVLAGVVGVQVVLRRLAFLTMAMTHATFPGIVVAAILGYSVYLGGAAAGLVAAVAILFTSRRAQTRRDTDTSTATGVVLATGFALGVALESSQAGFTTKLSELLVGSILTVQTSDLVISALVTLVVTAVFALLRKELWYTAFDAEGARAAGYPVGALRMLVGVAVTAAVVTSVPAVGVMLCVALIVAPAASARLWTDRVGTLHLVAIAAAVGSGVIGLELSRRFDVAAGGAITLVATMIFVVAAISRPVVLMCRRGTWRSRLYPHSPYTRRQQSDTTRRSS